MRHSRIVTVNDSKLLVQGRVIRVARLADEWHEDVEDPGALIREMAATGVKADLFTFWQRLPDSEPKFPYYRESEPIAVMPVTTYEHWLKHQINNKTRNLITKAHKRGLVVKSVPFDDEFVHGMVKVFNESPIRQGMRFWHYGKDFDTVKREFSTYIFREEVVGAYVDGELIGFIFIVNAGRYAMLGQIISMIRHRDKAPNNALIAKAVEICAGRKIPYLTYAVWPRPGSLRDFKRHNAFECVELPRYYIPVTARGRAALALNFHRDAIDQLPEQLVLRLKDLRSQFLAWRYRDTVAGYSSPSTQER